MRSVSLAVAAVVCCLACAPVAFAQAPAATGVQGQAQGTERLTEVVVAPETVQQIEVVRDEDETAVFEAIGEEPAPDPDPEATKLRALGVDPLRTAETLTNAVLNANGAVWDPTLGGLSTGDAVIDRYIVDAGRKHGVDPRLIHAVMHQESKFKKNAVSPKGASGYMQLMPATARRFGVTNIFDPQQNIDAGTKYLRFLLDLFDNNVELALAGYNAGEYRVIREGYRVPPIRETRNYVAQITSNYYGKSKRHYAVTYGRSALGKKERDEIAQEASETLSDRGTDGLSNLY